MDSPRKKILVSHPWIARGGSEATAMWTLDALQHDYEITFVTAHVDSWDELNAAYGTEIQSERVKVALCSRLPKVNGPTRLVHLQHRHFEKFCQRLAPQFDLCISTYNPVDFGDANRSIQLIGDFSFSEKMRLKLYGAAHTNYQHQATFTRSLYLKVGQLIGVKEVPLIKRKNDLVLANSKWAEEQLIGEFGFEKADVLYPPVLLPESIPQVERRPLSFVCLGRVSPEKEIERLIEILAQVRYEHGRDVTLTVVGKLDESDYSQKIEKLIDKNSEWITSAGFLTADAKQNLLAEHEFAIHACRIEAFGIAVAEMASLGCLPIVPKTGGTSEIVEFEELHYDSVEQAVEKILYLLDNSEQAESIRNQLTTLVHRFGPRNFSNDLRRFVSSQIESVPVEERRTGLPIRKIVQRLSDPIFYMRRWSILTNKFQNNEVGERSLEEISHRRVYVVVAHPDDEVFCSGIICELAAKPDTEVRVLCLTRGEGGPLPRGMSRAQLGEKREAEMQESCEILGVSELRFLDHEDPVGDEFRTYPPDVSKKELAAQLAPYFRRFDSDVILTHGSWGEYWHPAHLLLHSAVLRSAKGRTVLTFQAEKESPFIPEITNQADPAHFKFDFSHHFDKRLAALEAHESQIGLFGHFANGTHVDFVKKTAKEHLSIQSLATKG